MQTWNPNFRHLFLSLAPHAAIAGALCRSVHKGVFVSSMHLSDICTAAGIAEVRSNAVERALFAGMSHGLFNRESEIMWHPLSGPFEELAISLEAVALYLQDIHVDSNIVEVVLTPPGSSSRMSDALRMLGLVGADLEHTEVTMHHIAAQAEHRFSVVTPFIDAGGITNLLSLYRGTRNGVQRILITRCQSGQIPAPLQAALPELTALGVAIHNYWLPRTNGYETFHAKVVLSDTKMAYLGSANMTHASLTLSMELGTLLSGQSARTLSNIIDAILLIAPKI